MLTNNGIVLPNAEQALRQAIMAASPWHMTLPVDRHTATVWSVAYSPDGTMIASASGIDGVDYRATIDAVSDNFTFW